MRAALADLRTRPLALVLHAGDIINGGGTHEQSYKELNSIAATFDAGQVRSMCMSSISPERRPGMSEFTAAAAPCACRNLCAPST